MQLKKVKTTVKVNLPAGEATPAPPLGPILGQHGVAIMEFVRAYNDVTKDLKGTIIPAVITIYEDRSFDFETKMSPVSQLIKDELKLEKGASKAGREKLTTLSINALKKIAEKKMKDLNTDNIEAAMKIVEGTARSMGIKIEK